MASIMLFSVHLMFVLTFAAYSISPLDSANTKVITRLYRKLLNKTRYEPAVRPANDSDLPLLVQCAFVPILHHVEVANQEIELRARVVMTWFDNRLAWNPAAYGGVNQLQVPVAEIWKPHLNFYERISKHSDQSFQTETEFATINSTGEISWITMATIRSFCQMSMTNFPHDKHTCILTFTTFQYQKTEVQLRENKKLLGNYSYKDYEIHHEVWDMDFTENDRDKPGYIECSYCLHDYSNISYIVALERINPVVATVTFFLPCFFLTILSSCTICFPRGSTEAPGFGLTCVLALTVFLLTLYSMLPGTRFCNLGKYIVGLICIVSFETIVAGLKLESTAVKRFRVFVCVCWKSLRQPVLQHCRGWCTKCRGNGSIVSENLHEDEQPLPTPSHGSTCTSRVQKDAAGQNNFQNPNSGENPAGASPNTVMPDQSPETQTTQESHNDDNKLSDTAKNVDMFLYVLFLLLIVVKLAIIAVAFVR